MIQNGTYLNIIDNSGAKIGSCIQVKLGHRRRYASVGDIVNLSVKILRSKRRASIRIKKGEIHLALIIRTKIIKSSFSGDKGFFLENSAILLKKPKKFVGTRIFGSVPSSFRFTKFLKVVSLSAGVSF